MARPATALAAQGERAIVGVSEGDAGEPRVDFAIGDVVRLRSDAVRMTVHSVDGKRVGCHWHDDEDALVEFDFDPRELIAVKRVCET